MTRIFTIGHSTLALEDFTHLLRQHDIALLADVRSHPGSRRYPHFNRDFLNAALPEAGMGYRHFPALGGRRRASKESRNTAWRNASFRAYADYLETPEFQAGLSELIAAAKQQPLAIMCAEALWWRCHRALISDALKISGHEVLHIGSDGGLTLHPFTTAAAVVDGKLSYRGKERTVHET